ncbi:era-like GTP-binding protein [Hysterangium stoloniferum]|nr:era-like GTP-binding protein [Hysterangium stoloniferum]
MSQQQLENLNNLRVERFRILVIGNANAGKTTILEKVCHPLGPPRVDFDTKLEPSASRGNHDIEQGFQIPTAHGFIFHDSCGFEAGGTGELEKVKDFIENRAKSEQLKDRLHVIWYCLSTSNDRGMTDAEMSLFQNGTGNVPIIVVFTKMDALDQVARNQLMWNDDLSPESIKKEVPIRAEAIFKERYLKRLDEVKHKPRYIVKLRGMQEWNASCNELVVKTSNALDRDTLNLFCFSILRNSIESRTKQVINE